jgi:hypothetical protein
MHGTDKRLNSCTLLRNFRHQLCHIRSDPYHLETTGRRWKVEMALDRSTLPRRVSTRVDLKDTTTRPLRRVTFERMWRQSQSRGDSRGQGGFQLRPSYTFMCRNVTEVRFLRCETLPLRRLMYRHCEGKMCFPTPRTWTTLDRPSGTQKEYQEASRCAVQADPRSDETSI